MGGWVLDSCVCAVIACAGGGGLAVSTILVGVAEMAAEGCEGFGCIVLAAPFAAGHIEHSGGVNDIVADADDGCFTRCIVAGGGESDSDVELSEEGLDWSRRIPWCLHAELIFIKLILRDFTVVGPEVGKDVETGDMSISKSGIVEVFDVMIGDGIDDLGTKGLVDFVVSAEDRACDEVEAIDFGDLVGSEAGRMFNDWCWVCGRQDRNSREDGIVCWGKGESDVAVEAIIAAVRRDRGGVCVELGLSGAKCCVGRRVSSGGDGCELDGGKGCSDDTGGEGGCRHNYQLLLMNLINH